MPTPAPPPEDGGEDNGEDGDDPDSDGDNEEAEPQEEAVPDAGGEDVVPVEGDEEPGMWEETFKSHSDSKPYGRCIHFSLRMCYICTKFQVPVPLEWISHFPE